MASVILITCSGEEEERLGMCDSSQPCWLIARDDGAEACVGAVQTVKVRATGLLTLPGCSLANAVIPDWT